MLNICITDTSGNVRQLDNILSVVINSSVDVPADDITVTLPYNAEMTENADMISVYSEDRLVFYGQIDEISNLNSAQKAVTKICARSLASALLDNEAEPLTYYRPETEFIYKQHLKPYGIAAEITDNKIYSGVFRIEKGMSQWQVAESFCKSCYGKQPRITGDGRALFSEIANSDEILFGVDGINYRSICDSFKRCELISKVKVRLSEYGSYSTVVNNLSQSCEGINRVRYVNAVADNKSLNTADTIIKNSNEASKIIELECVGCYLDLIGKRAAVDDRLFGKIDGLRIKRIKYSFGINGEITAVTLGKED